MLTNRLTEYQQGNWFDFLTQEFLTLQVSGCKGLTTFVGKLSIVQKCDFIKVWIQPDSVDILRSIMCIVLTYPDILSGDLEFDWKKRSFEITRFFVPGVLHNSLIEESPG